MSRLKTWAATVAMFTVSGAAMAGPVLGQGTWETTLKARDIDRNEVTLDSTDAYFFYDTVLDITWLGDWNASGLMDWASANTWAASLDINGLTGWRLPELSGTLNTRLAATGTDYGYNVNTANSELAHMFYDTLDNLAYFDTRFVGPQPGWGLSNTAYFTKMQPGAYWSGTEFAPDPSSAWVFSAGTGIQSFGDKSQNVSYAVAVRAGDVLATQEEPQAVPEPGTLALLLAAIGVGAIARRRRAH